MHWKDHYDSPIEHGHGRGTWPVWKQGDLLGGCSSNQARDDGDLDQGYRMKTDMGSRCILERDVDPLCYCIKKPICYTRSSRFTV